jgi:DNA-binding PadR family transcriptional regulator
MSVARTLLGLLEGSPAHGYTLKQRYDQRFARVKPLPFGQVYASLARFERDGLAVVTGTESGDGPERTLYAITPDGVTAVETWILSPEEPTTYAASVLFAKVTLALMSGRPAAQILDAQRAVHLARMRELTADRRDADGLDTLAITYELNHLDADLRWIEEAGQRIDTFGIQGD